MSNNEEKKGHQEPFIDAFGMGGEEIKPEVKQDPKIKPEVKQGSEIKPEVKQDDFADNPVIVSMREEIKKVRDEYGGNLSAQREIIKKLEARVRKEKEKEEDDQIPFKVIKRSKELKSEERDEMTDTEILQMDMIADMQERHNDLWKELRAKTKEKDTSQTTTNLQELVHTEALLLADGKTDVANQIIDMVKLFNLEGLDEAAIKLRVADAVKLLPDYKPSKEQPTAMGKSVKNNQSSSDPFGVDTIIKEATKGNNGSYDL